VKNKVVEDLKGGKFTSGTVGKMASDEELARLTRNLADNEDI
jgi:hypothetical protein